MVTNLPGLPHKLASSTDDALPARSQAIRATNTTAGQNMNQVLFRVGESIEMLSNRVFDPFPSKIDGEINGFVWGLEVNNGGRERESSCSALNVLK